MSTNFEDLIGRGVTGSKPAAGVPGRLYYDTTLEQMERDTGSAWEKCEPTAGGSGDITYAAIQASQLVNEIKGWPPVVQPDADLVTLGLWWDDVGTPTTSATVVDVSGESITEDYEMCLKVVAAAASDGLMQRFTYADEPRVKSGRALSTLWAIWCVGGVGATLSIINSSSEETAASEVTAAAWTIVEVPNHTLAGTYCDIKIVSDGAGTFYAVPLGANIGARGFPLPQRPSRQIDTESANVLNGIDPGGAGYTDLDLTSVTSPLTWSVGVSASYSCASADSTLKVRRNGCTHLAEEISRVNVAGKISLGNRIVNTDDGQIVEYATGIAAGTVESIYLHIYSYMEWA